MSAYTCILTKIFLKIFVPVWIYHMLLVAPSTWGQLAGPWAQKEALHWPSHQPPHSKEYNYILKPQIDKQGLLGLCANTNDYVNNSMIDRVYFVWHEAYVY